MSKTIDPESKEAVGQRLKWTRLAVMKGDSNQAAFCRKLDITPQKWNNWETGDNLIPVPEALKLVRVFKVTLPWIYQGQEADLPASLLEKIDETRTSPRQEAAATKKK